MHFKASRSKFLRHSGIGILIIGPLITGTACVGASSCPLHVTGWPVISRHVLPMATATHQDELFFPFSAFSPARVDDLGEMPELTAKMGCQI